MTAPLTDRQSAILEFIREHVRTKGFPPTMREIGEAFGIRSTNGVNDHLKALERKGCIKHDRQKSRTLSIVLQPEGEM